MKTELEGRTKHFALTTIGRKAKNTRRVKLATLAVLALGALIFSLSAFPLSAFSQ